MVSLTSAWIFSCSFPLLCTFSKSARSSLADLPSVSASLISCLALRYISYLATSPGSETFRHASDPIFSTFITPLASAALLASSRVLRFAYAPSSFENTVSSSAAALIPRRLSASRAPPYTPDNPAPRIFPGTISNAVFARPAEPSATKVPRLASASAGSLTLGCLRSHLSFAPTLPSGIRSMKLALVGLVCSTRARRISIAASRRATAAACTTASTSDSVSPLSMCLS